MHEHVVVDWAGRRRRRSACCRHYRTSWIRTTAWTCISTPSFTSSSDPASSPHRLVLRLLLVYCMLQCVSNAAGLLCMYVWAVAVQESYLLLYRALEAFCSEEHLHGSADKDSGISNCNNYRGSLPPGVLPGLPPPAVIRSSSRNSAIRHDSPHAGVRTSTL